jgi:hypothetical protein
LFFELGQSVFIERPCVIFGDNAQAIRLSDSGTVSERFKHILLKYHFCCEQVENGTIDFQYVSSHENLGGVFTKVVCGPKTKAFNSLLGLVPKS